MVILELSRSNCRNVIPLIHFLSPFILYSGPWGELEAIPAITGNTLDESPVCHRTDGERQAHSCLHLWTVLINLAWMSLDCGRTGDRVLSIHCLYYKRINNSKTSDHWRKLNVLSQVKMATYFYYCLCMLSKHYSKAFFSHVSVPHFCQIIMYSIEDLLFFAAPGYKLLRRLWQLIRDWWHV